MRTLFLAAVVALGSLSMSQSASSMPAGPLAIQSENPIETVAYVCRRVRVCGPHGCGWRRRCWETGRRWGGYGGGYDQRGGYGGESQAYQASYSAAPSAGGGSGYSGAAQGERGTWPPCLACRRRPSWEEGCSLCQVLPRCWQPWRGSLPDWCVPG